MRSFEPISVEPGNLRDATYLSAHMREHDWSEIECQVPPHFTKMDAAITMFLSTDADLCFCAKIGGQPVFIFGLVRVTEARVEVWGYGSLRTVRVIPAVSRFLYKRVAKLLVGKGLRRVEARIIKTNRLASLWFKAIGGNQRPDLSDHGRNGETFEFWEWTRNGYDKSTRARDRFSG